MKLGMDFRVGDLVELDTLRCTSHYARGTGPAIVAKVLSSHWGLFLEVVTPDGPTKWLQRETKVINRNENR